MKNRDIRQRHLYADHRMVVAIDRLLDAKTDSEREKASKWVYAWRNFSGCHNPDAVSLSTHNHQEQNDRFPHANHIAPA